MAVVAAIRSVVTYVVALAYIAIVGPIGLMVALVLRWKRGLYALGHAGVALALGLSGIRYRVAGLSNVPGEPVVFCSNHESNVDPPVLFLALHPQLHILYKAELHKFPIMGKVFDLGGFVPVPRENREQAMQAIERGADSIRSGNSFLIFPEGTRSRSGELLPFKKGGFIMAIKAQAPIVPVAVQGGRDSMRRGSWIVRPVTVSIRIGAPIETSGFRLDERNAVIETTRNRMTALLAEGPVLAC